MRLALTMRVVSTAGYVEPRDAISHDWVSWLDSMGHELALIPNCLRRPDDMLRCMGVDALVLTGGNDVALGLEGSGDVSSARNDTERLLLSAALERRIPVLGVCRGLHMVNTFFGGGLTVDLGVRTPDHVARMHTTTLAPPFDRLAGSARITTNSFHRQAVRQEDLGTGLIAFAASHDGLVEGLHHREYQVIAVQWHPERPGPSALFDRRLLCEFLEGSPVWLRAPR